MIFEQLINNLFTEFLNKIIIQNFYDFLEIKIKLIKMNNMNYYNYV